MEIKDLIKVQALVDAQMNIVREDSCARGRLKSIKQEIEELDIEEHFTYEDLKRLKVDMAITQKGKNKLFSDLEEDEVDIMEKVIDGYIRDNPELLESTQYFMNTEFGATPVDFAIDEYDKIIITTPQYCVELREILERGNYRLDTTHESLRDFLYVIDTLFVNAVDAFMGQEI